MTWTYWTFVQQDDASHHTLHTSRTSMTVLREHIPERIISTRGIEEIANITPMLAKVIANSTNRFTHCMKNEGRYLPDLIFKTKKNNTASILLHYKTQLKIF